MSTSTNTHDKINTFNTLATVVNNLAPRLTSILCADVVYKKDFTPHKKYLSSIAAILDTPPATNQKFFTQIVYGQYSVWLKVTAHCPAIDCFGNSCSVPIYEEVSIFDHQKTIQPEHKPRILRSIITYMEMDEKLSELEKELQNIKSEIQTCKNYIEGVG